jgi:hypothetical protein
MTSRNQRDAALADALSSGMSYRQAAEHTGYSLSTVQRRMRDHGFRRRVEEIRAGRLTAINDRLLNAAIGAVERLSWLIEHGESHAVQARAAVGLLAHARQYVETVELEAKVREIEALLGDELKAHRGEAAHA